MVRPRYHPRVETLVRDVLGWSSLRDVQAAAIVPITARLDTLIMASTAAGKTEAAALAWLSSVFEYPDTPNTAIWIAPTRALATQLHERLDRLCRAAGLRAHLRHSDAAMAERREWENDPGELLVTTAESIEAMLLGGRDGRGLPAGLERLGTVVVDELHGFAAGSRGVHLMSLLARLEQRLRRRVQRIGLSATIANAHEVWAWFCGDDAERAVIEVPAAPRDRRLWLEAFADDEARLDALAATLRDRRALVFCNSRRAVDETTHALLGRGIEARAHHGTIAAESRESAEEALRDGDVPVLVCTSTLELGIDVGHLDTVVQLDAPPSVAAFVQRIGRAARRPGQIGHVWLLTVGREQTRRAWAVVSLAMERWLEPIERPDGDDVLRHQVLAMTVADGFDAARQLEALRRVSLWGDMSEADFGDVVDSMVATGWLARIDERLVPGEVAAARFGAPHWAGMCATFGDGRRSMVLERDGVPLGEIDARVGVGDTVWMDGAPWRIESVDGGRVAVAPSVAGHAGAAAGGGFRGRAMRHHPDVLARAAAGASVRESWIGERAWAVIAERRA